MSGRRGENPSVVTGIGGLDAEEFFIAFVREVGERSRLFFPRIPDHCGEREFSFVILIWRCH